MKRSRRLEQLARLAGRRVDEAAREVRASNERLERHYQTQNLLDEARERHLGDVNQELEEGTAAFRLKLIAQSIQNLGSGLSQMAGKISAAEAQRGQAVGHWTAARVRARAIDNAAGRARSWEAVAEQARADHEVDDQAARKAAGGPHEVG